MFKKQSCFLVCYLNKLISFSLFNSWFIFVKGIVVIVFASLENLFQKVGPRKEMQNFDILSCCFGTEKLFLAFLIGYLCYIEWKLFYFTFYFQCVIAWIMLIPESSNFSTLINYFSFAAWTFYGATISALLWLRYKRPDIERPYKVYHALYLVVCKMVLWLFLVNVFNKFCSWLLRGCLIDSKDLVK